MGAPLFLARLTQCYWTQMDRSAIAVVVLLLLGSFLRESYAVSYREPLQSVFKSFRILEFYCAGKLCGELQRTTSVSV